MGCSGSAERDHLEMQKLLLVAIAVAVSGVPVERPSEAASEGASQLLRMWELYHGPPDDAAPLRLRQLHWGVGSHEADPCGGDGYSEVSLTCEATSCNPPFWCDSWVTNWNPWLC